MPGVTRFFVDTVVFDMDGTLLNSRAFAIDAVREGLAHFFLRNELPNHPSYHDDEIAGRIGLPADEFYKSLLPNEYKHRYQELHASIFAAENRRIEAGETSLFPGVSEVLEELRSQGFRLGLVSNCTSGYLEASSKAHRLDTLFHARDCVGNHYARTKADVLQLQLQLLESRAAAMVGDRVHDIEAAHICGAFAIAATYGFGNANELADADGWIEDFRDLTPLLQLAP